MIRNSQCFRNELYSESIATEKLRLARHLEIVNNAKLEEMESALITQAVEKDMCEESIACMERDLDARLAQLRATLTQVKGEEQQAMEKLNCLLSSIKSKLDHLNLTVKQFT